MRTRHVTLGGLVVASLVGVRPASAGDPWADGRPLPVITATTAVIHGVVRDQDGAGVLGATVVATGPALDGSRAEISDADGCYAIADLPPGTYRVDVYYANLSIQRASVVAAAGARARIDLTVDTSAVGGEVIEISDGAPTIDRSYSKNIPVPGRTFESALGKAAGSAGDSVGASFSGSSSTENVYIVDGADTLDRSQGARMPMLTATAVPDADRWADYRQFLDGHSDLRDELELRMDRRLRVRVVDAAGQPVNDAVVVVTGPGSVRGRTHADGVWDFFPGVDAPQRAGLVDLEVTAEGSRTQLVVSPTTPEIRVALPVRSAAPAALDLAFAIDVTGSMGDELDYVTRELAMIVARIRAAAPGVTVRLGGVAYRDRGDAVPLATRPFDSDVNGFVAWLRSLHADGGGDYPEDMESGLQAAMHLDWSKGNVARVLVVLGDAPPKRYPDAQYRFTDAMRDARAAGVRLLPVAASGADRTVEYLFRAFGAYTSTPYVYLTDDSGIGNDHLEADAAPTDVERFNDLLVRMVVSDLHQHGMHAPGNWKAWRDYRAPPWQGKPRRLVAGLGAGVTMLASYRDIASITWARAGIAFGDLELRFHLGWSNDLDRRAGPRALARVGPGETMPAASSSLALVPGATVRYLFGPWQRVRAFAAVGLEEEILRGHPADGVATMVNSQAGFELRSPDAAGLAAGVQVGGHVMLYGQRDITTPRPHLDLSLYVEHRF